MRTSWHTRLEFLLLPGRCCLCDGNSRQESDLCLPCRRELPWLGTACRRCAIPLTASHAAPGERVCGPCATRPPPFENAWAAFRYVWPVDRMILNFKERGHLASGRVLAELVLDSFSEGHRPAADLLVPVPLHRRKLRERGFNQSREIARTLGAGWGIPVTTAARRVRDTLPNKRLSRADRLHNLRHAFLARTRFGGEHVMIVDDVMTTGATARALAQTLLAAGAGAVSVCCIARTP
ncbi:MAG: ComF family protein [Proteobacteria bacterium]|jgi:ComF family protein|nr:ComF family protein [Pseudomonadota bacterium]MDA1301875.1 ComF family protein [Pseudomonadota bacterium]